jgi:hypothetical protein
LAHRQVTGLSPDDGSAFPHDPDCRSADR